MEDTENWSAIITAIVALAVALISGVITIWINIQARKNEHRLAILKVLLEAGYKEYEFRANQDIERAKHDGKPLKVKSFTEYIIFYKSLAETFSKKKITEKDIEEALRKNKILIDAYYQQREEHRPEYHKPPPATR